MTSRRIVMLVVIAVVIAFTAGAASAAAMWWTPIIERGSQGYITASGQMITRYQWRVNEDRNSGACFVILTDTDTGQFDLTAVDPSVCAVRRPAFEP